MREVREELGIRVKVVRPLMSVPHAYTHFRITLHVYECRYLSGKPRAIGCAEWRWVKTDELDQFAFPSACRPAEPPFFASQMLKQALCRTQLITYCVF